jgi:CheY-like chemotaxis protein
MSRHCHFKGILLQQKSNWMTMEGMVQSEKAVKDSSVIDAQAQAARTQILVIEDDPHMQKVLQRIFREQGYAVTSAAMARQGWMHSAPARRPR